MSDEHNSETPVEPAPKGSAKAKMMTFASVAHALPFFLWIGIMLLAGMMHLTPSSGSEDIKSLDLISDAWMYAIRTVLCVVALCILRPWRYYPALKIKNILPAIGVGLAVFVLWVGFETETFKNFAPGLADLYERYCVDLLHFGEARDFAASADKPSPYSPLVCGWPLAIIRLLGSALVIATIEEFFWRGYLLRTIKTPDFLDLDISYYNPKIFFAVALLFGVNHAEYAVVGAITGVIYGFLYIKTRDIWAASIAHITTNFVLGVYVLASGKYYFW